VRSLVPSLATFCLLGVIFTSQVQSEPRPPGPGAPGAPVGPGDPGGGSTHVFQLQMCNKGSREAADIYVATADATRDGRIRVQGWWKLPANQCVNLGEFPRPGIFAYGMSGSTIWSDPEPSLCVDLRAKFDYAFNPDAGRPCREGYEPKGFFMIQIDDESNTKTFTLNW
jgi:hypothetical protein